MRTVLLPLIALLSTSACGDDDAGRDASLSGDSGAMADVDTDGAIVPDVDVVDGGVPDGVSADVPGDGGMSPPPSTLPWEDCEGSGRMLSAGPADYRDVLSTLEAGDTLQLAPGRYERGLPVRTSGEEGRCIVIEGTPGMERPLFLGSNAFNIIEFRAVQWVKVRGLDIDGMGLDGFGVASQGDEPVHHIVVEDLEMRGLAGSQQIVGISTKSVAWDWVIRGNRILEAGTGMYFGNSDGRRPFIRGLIEGNLVLNPLGYCIQIKHQVEAGRGALGLPDLPDEATTVVRYNVWAGAESGGGDSGARPNMLLGDVPASGSGSNDRTLVYGNLFYQNPVENLFQGEGNIALYSNVFITSGQGGILVQPHNGVPRNVEVFHNTIIAAGRGISVSGGGAGYSQTIHSNVVFAGMAIRGGGEASVTNNLEGQVSDASSVLANPMGAIGADLDLRPQSPETVMGEPQTSELLHAGFDFDGHPRDGSSRGAYEPGLTGWQLALERR